MLTYTLRYVAESGPPVSLRVQAPDPKRAAEEAARCLKVKDGRFKVYCRFDSRSVVYEGEIRVAAGRAQAGARP